MIFERDLYPPILLYLRENGFNYYEEVKFLTRQIDIIGKKEKKIIAIEIKVSNWQRALQQALTCRLCADESYIAISEKYSHRVKLELLKEYGIGLIIVKENEMEIVQKAKKSKIIHTTIIKKMLQEIEGRKIDS